MPSFKNSFCKSMRNMFAMFYRMAVRAKNFQIVHAIIFSISILVMNSKNFFNFIKSTPFAFYNKISCKHIFPNGAKTWIPVIYFWFIYASFAAKHFFLRWACKKFYAAMFAIFFNRSLMFLRNVITFSAAIFSNVRSGRYVTKIIFANFAVRFRNNSSRKCFTRSGTIFKTFKSIYWNINISPAISTIHFFSGARL